MSTHTASSNDKSPSGEDGNSTEEASGTYECNICLETANDAVVSLCGHLFCWPCLHQWLETSRSRQTCPVCKAGISRDKVIPIYGRGNPNPQDPRKKSPPRPQGQRSEPDQRSEGLGAFPNFGLGGDGGFQFSFGIGAFPFGIFASSFNFNNARPVPPTPGSTHQAQDEVLSKFFLWIGIFFIIWLLLT